MGHSEKPTEFTSHACKLSDGELSDIVGGEDLTRYNDDQLKARFLECRSDLRSAEKYGFPDALMMTFTQYRDEMLRRGMEIPKEDAL